MMWRRGNNGAEGSGGDDVQRQVRAIGSGL